MDAKSRSRRFRLAVLLLVIIGDSILLNVSTLYYEPFAYWILVGIPAGLLCGFWGSVRRVKFLRAVGWLAVCLFTLFEVASTSPGEEYTLGGPGSPPGPVPHLLPHELLRQRLLLFSVSSLVLIVCYWMAGKAEERGKVQLPSE